MNNRHYFLTIVLLLSCSLYAQHRSTNEALRLAKDYLNTEYGETGELSVLPKAKMAVPGSNASLNGTYIVNDNDNGRFVVVSADERMLPILGYSDNGALSLDNAPDGLLFMLQSYEKQYNYTLENADKVTIRTTTVDTPVEPLITAKWGQDTPYNNECPILSNQRCVTGCVATAMAQVMHYYQYPTQCQGGTFSYTSASNAIAQTLNFDNISFDWSKMPDSYDNSSPADSKAEVAKLMHACGVSVSMDYGLSNTGGSGGFDVNIPYALKTYFGYQSEVCYKEKQYYSPDEWEKMIIEDLQAGHPLFYGGAGTRGGHQFILDGVNAEGKFHFNFGWQGNANGYFALNAVNPKPNSTTYDFNDDQSMVYKVSPESFGEQKEDVFYGISFDIGSTTMNVGDNTSILFSAYCYSSDATYQENNLAGFNGQLGMAVFDNEFNFIRDLGNIALSDVNISEGKGASGQMTISGFGEDGTYYFAMYAQGEDSPGPTLVHFHWGDTQCYKAEVKDGVITFSPKYDLVPDFNLTVTDAGISTLYLDHAVKLPADRNLLGVFYVNGINGNILNLARVKGTLPAKTAVIIMANKGTLAFESATDEVEPITDNLLLGTTTPLPVADIDGIVYTLGRGVNSGYMGFHKYTGTNIPANKAYLVRDTNSSVNSFNFSYGEANAILTVDEEYSDNPAVIYDLQGRRINNPTRGIYIINGKKILIH
ncbi:MAG: C10 family peptidase [Bacteroidaceae bacterium]|nr:C10 family peptidase [Bacteroidaceae bacterium]